jgi:hypothetical protein
VLVACFYLAGKVTECPKRAARDLTELVLRANRLWLRQPAQAAPTDLAPDQLASLKRDVLSCERTLLHAIAFDLIVPNPQTFLMEKIKLAAFDTPTVPAALKKTFGEKTFYFLKFAMRTSLCLQFPPSYLAAAAVRPPPHPPRDATAYTPRPCFFLLCAATPVVASMNLFFWVLRQVGLSAAYLGLPIFLPGASGPVSGGPIEPLTIPARPVGAQAVLGAVGPPPQLLVVSGSPLLAGGSPAMAPGGYGGGDASSPGDQAPGSAPGSAPAAAAEAAAAHAVWQQVLGPVTGAEFASLAAQILEAFKWSEGDAAAATPCATALEARLKALGVLSAAAARPGPGKADKAPGAVAAAGPKPRPPPPPPPPGAPPPPPSGEPDSKRVKS